MTPVDQDKLQAALDHFRGDFQRLRDEIGKVVVGQQQTIVNTLVALVAGGHVLLEGVPGLGKTLLVRTLAAAVRSPRPT
jgi:MoxR-like ATPase